MTISIDRIVFDLPCDAGKAEIIERLWGPKALPQEFHNGFEATEIDLQAYFQYYTNTCAIALHDGGRHVAVRTHRHILDLVQHLRAGHDRESIKKMSPLAGLLGNVYIKDASIDLAAKILLMLNFGELRCGFSLKRRVPWDHGSLKDAVHDYFSYPPTLVNSPVKLERRFTAENIHRLAGIEVAWTDNLADHLRMLDDDKRVAIFHHVTFLECQHSSSIFPPGLVEETFRTIALLFPQGDAKTAKWIKEHHSKKPLDARLLQCGIVRYDDRHIENFHFWRDRLVILKQVYDEAHPRTISQSWWDRRNGVQWYTFWIAVLILILTIFFGVVQSIEGALQVYKAYVPSR